MTLGPPGLLSHYTFPPPCLCVQFVPIMGFECRGLEPVSYQPETFIVKSKGGQTFEADLSEG